MEFAVNNNQYYARIKDFKIPNLPYTPVYSSNTVQNSLAPSNLINYTNTENRAKKVFPIIAFCGAVVVGAAAFLNTSSGKKAIDAANTRRLLMKFNNFNLSKAVEQVPDDKTLMALVNDTVKDVALKPPVFDESKVTEADIANLIKKYTYADYRGDMAETLPKKISADDKLKHLLNNLLALCHKEDSSTDINKISIWLFSKFFEEYNLDLDKNQIDTIFKFYTNRKTSSNLFPLEDIKQMLQNLDILKITGLNEYLKKECPDITKHFDVENILSTQPSLSFDDYSNFITALRKGNLEGHCFFGGDFDFKIAAKFLNSLNENSIKLINFSNIDKIFSNAELSPKALSQKLNNLSQEKIKQVYISNLDFSVFFDFEEFLGAKNINEIDAHQKRRLMQKLVKNNADVFKANSSVFPILPKTRGEYCALLQKLSKSIGISTKPLTSVQIANFEKTISSLASSIKDVDLGNASLTLKMSRDEFVSQAQKLMAKLKESEQNKVMDYYGFEIKDGKLTGYPINVNNGEKLKEIKSSATKKVVEALRPVVEEFSGTENVVKIEGCTNAKDLERDLNQLFIAFPELRSIIGRKQHSTHAFSLDIHTLKVLQNVCLNPKFKELSDSDKKILEISAILHDITKVEGARDVTHPFESAFDAFYIIQKLNLPESDQLKIYQLIKCHNWLDRLNNPKNKDMVKNIAQDVAFDSRHTNTFELAKILCEADLKSVRKDTSFFKRFESVLEEMSNLVDSYIKKLHGSQIVLPQTRIPRASQLLNGQQKTANGITNNVIYLNKANNDLSLYGFDKDTTKDNFLALVHALEYEEQLRKFDTFGTIDTEALLSTSYIKADDYHVFRKQGLILDVAFDDIHAGYFQDFGTGYSKDIELLKEDYLFHGDRKNVLNDNAWRSDRSLFRYYISGLIKRELNLKDEEYVSYMEKIKDCKTITDIENVDKGFADGLLRVFKNMQSGKRRGGRSYNEMLVSRPRIQGVFAYDKKYEKIPLFLRKYAQEHDLPVIIFGNV